MQNDIDIFSGIKSAIQKNPENFKPAGQWLDDFCQDIVNQAEQRIQKLPQIKSAASSEIQNKERLLKNIQHQHETLRKRIAGHEHNDEKFKEEKQQLSTLHAEAYQLTLEVYELKRELEKNKNSSQDEPSFVLLMSKASGEAFCEYPPDSRKIMVIAWVVTDRFLSESNLGITKYEQYAFNHEVIRPGSNGLPQLITVQEWAKEAVLVRPDAMVIIRDAYLSYKGSLPEESGGMADLPNEKSANINIQNSNVILGDVQAENVQTGDYTSIHKDDRGDEKKKGIIGKILKIIGSIIGSIFVAVVVDILGDFGLIKWIKTIFHNILTIK